MSVSKVIRFLLYFLIALCFSSCGDRMNIWSDDLRISSSSMLDLIAKENIEMITGDLVITVERPESHTVLEGVSGEEVEVDWTLEIPDCLKIVTGSVIIDSSGMTRIKGGNGLELVGGALAISYCEKLVGIDAFGSLNDLSVLNVKTCLLLEDLAVADPLESLTRLELINLPLLKHCPILRKIKRVDNFYLGGLTRLQKEEISFALEWAEDIALSGSQIDSFLSNTNPQPPGPEPPGLETDGSWVFSTLEVCKDLSYKGKTDLTLSFPLLENLEKVSLILDQEFNEQRIAFFPLSLPKLNKCGQVKLDLRGLAVSNPLQMLRECGILNLQLTDSSLLSSFESLSSCEKLLISATRSELSTEFPLISQLKELDLSSYKNSTLNGDFLPALHTSGQLKLQGEGVSQWFFLTSRPTPVRTAYLTLSDSISDFPHSGAFELDEEGVLGILRVGGEQPIDLSQLSLTKMQMLQVANCPSISGVIFPSGLTSIGRLIIIHNPGMNFLSGYDSLTTVRDSLECYDNAFLPQSNVDAFLGNLANFRGIARIYGNDG